MRDGQRQAIYTWEDSVVSKWPEKNESITLDQCAELVRKVWADYRPGDEPPKIKDGRGCRQASGSRWRIKLPVWSRKKIIVLHEIGHSLQINQPWHGREFARLVLELWGHYAGIPISEAKTMGIKQRPRRVHFTTAADAPKPISLKWKIWKKVEQSILDELRKHRAGEPPKN